MSETVAYAKVGHDEFMARLEPHHTLEQPSVHDNKKTVQTVLDEAGVTVKAFARLSVGGA